MSHRHHRDNGAATSSAPSTGDGQQHNANGMTTSVNFGNFRIPKKRKGEASASSSSASIIQSAVPPPLSKKQRKRARQEEANGYPPQQPHYGGVPARWEDYSSMGWPIEGTPFLCFKTPLRSEITRQIEEQFTAADMVAMLMSSNIRLDMIICLTGTDRYYDQLELERQSGIPVRWIRSSGHNVHQDHHVYRAFENAVASCQGNGLIGVHCTHGINRTGFVVCKYMVERLGFAPKVAIDEFEAARGEKIEREQYIDAIKGCKAKY